ncbi:hypothetical protein BLOT_003710 [Blomia tropicalis]|nr:hypothetical protein BLOT_003710 [Blomia tropicalis]
MKCLMKDVDVGDDDDDDDDPIDCIDRVYSSHTLWIEPSYYMRQEQECARTLHTRLDEMTTPMTEHNCRVLVKRAKTRHDIKENTFNMFSIILPKTTKGNKLFEFVRQAINIQQSYALN